MAALVSIQVTKLGEKELNNNGVIKWQTKRGEFFIEGK